MESVPSYNNTYFVEGRQFIIFTDHKPLTTTFHANKTSYTPTQFRHLLYISQFPTDIRYVQGNNAPVDALSKNINSLSSQSPVIDYATIATAQANCDDLQRLLDNPFLKMEKIQVPGTDIRLNTDVSTGNLHPFIPTSFRHELFRHLHDLAHPGIRASQRMLTSKFIWPSINKDVRHWARTCLQCQASKVTRHTLSPLTPFPLVSTRFSHMYIDIIGPLPYSNGYKYVFTCVDRFTRWPEAIPLPDINTDTVARAFVDNWVARFGVPTNLTSDRGSQFESTLWNKVMALLGIRRYRTASYHPQANGMVERFHRQLKAALYAHALNNELWSVALSLVLLGIRTSLKVDIGHSPAELVFGTTLRLPGEFIADVPHSNSCTPHDFAFQLKETMAKLHPVPPRQAKSPRTFVSQDLLQCTHVFVRTDAVRKALQPPCEGSFKVLRRTRKTVTIQRNGKLDQISIDRVKPAHLFDPMDTPVNGTPIPTLPKRPQTPRLWSYRQNNAPFQRKAQTTHYTSVLEEGRKNLGCEAWAS
ncbi:uncharacterized protein LOC143024086 [Oratosquilla oratoria]|uniref:uncharacterized protein LOC143024086 n=1 Tax=Oratosquilla oratoria TaxID=337810 RepID=UPI003F7607CE